MKALLNIIQTEPAVVIGVVICILALAADYGLPVTGQHAEDIKNLITAVLILIGAVAIRSQVIPINTVTPPAPPSVVK